MGLFVFSQIWKVQMKLFIDTVVILVQLTTEHVKDTEDTILCGSTYRGTKPSVDTGKGYTNSGKAKKSTSYIIKHLWWET